MSKRIEQVNTTCTVTVSPKESLQNHLRILGLVCSNHKGVPLFDRAHALIRQKSWLKLVELADLATQQSYGSAHEHFRAHQLSALVKKFPWPDLGYNKEAAALRTFARAEHKCKRENQRIRCFSKRSPEEAFLDRMRGWIRYVLGDEPDIGKALSLCSYGPGSNVGLSGDATHEARKFLAPKCTVSAGAVSYARAASKCDPEFFEYYCRKYTERLQDVACDAIYNLEDDDGLYLEAQRFPSFPLGSYSDRFRVCDLRPWLEYNDEWELVAEHCGPRFTEYLTPVSWNRSFFDNEFERRLKIVNYNKIALVPKTVLTDRTVGAEPLWNSFVQSGAGELISLLLKRVGIDITDQTRNGHLAFVASLFGHLVTIDLSSASDTIAIELCRLLLPPAWFDFLNSIRSKYYRLPGDHKSHRYHKFTSMGNGFCFPLETLLFAAVCEAANQEVCGDAESYSVYGDDIIVPTETSARVLQMLRYCGFLPNARKTFTSGPFRESCGKDWYAGYNVRPLFVDRAFETYNDYYNFHNQIVREPRFAEFFAGVPAAIRRMVPSSFRFVRPFRGVGDSAFEVSLDMFMSSKFSRWDRETRSWGWKELMVRAVTDKSFVEQPGYSQAYARAAMHGSSSASPYQLRRKTETKVRKISHWGICEDVPAPRIYYTIRGHAVAVHRRM